MIESNAWPNITSMRVQLDPISILNHSDGHRESLWTFLAKQADNGMDYDFNLTLAFQKLGMRYMPHDEKEVYTTFKLGVCCEIWIRSADNCQKISCLIRPKYKRVALLQYYAKSREELEEKFQFCPTKKEFTRSHLLVDDLFTCTIKQVLYCDNNNCRSFFLEQNELEHHQTTCVNGSQFEPKVIYKQIRMSEFVCGEQLLQTFGFVHSINNFVCYDIECCTAAPTDSKKRNQTIISISARKSWSNESVCFLRRDSNAGSGFQLMHEFINYLDQCQREYKQKFCNFESIRQQLDLFANRLNIYKNYEVQSAFQLLDDYERLRVIAFNGEKYDLPECYPYLCAYYGQKEVEFSCIKRGNGEIYLKTNDESFLGIMMFTTPTLNFMDIVNHIGKMSLAKFAVNYCNSDDQDGKGLFPHDFFRSIEEIRECREFPPYEAFQSNLNLPTLETQEK